MTAPKAAAKADPKATALDRVVDYLGELGPRWGLPAEACRVHGYLYLVARPITASELRDGLGLSAPQLDTALAWLADYRLVERVCSDGWRTNGDPWELMVRALEERQRREIGPALAVLRDCHEDALAERGPRRAVAGQIGKLAELAEDFAGINAQAHRMSPRMLRQMVRFGGLASRFIDRTWGRSDRPRRERP